jgi:hypothetical protein
MNVKGCGWKRRGLIQLLPENLSGVRKTNEEQILDVLVKITTKHLPNTSQNAEQLIY